MSYGVIRQSIPLNDLENYANKGNLNGSAFAFVPMFMPEQSSQLQQILTTPIPFNDEQVKTFLNTSVGEQIVYDLAALIDQDVSQARISAIQVALVRATAAPNGLTLLSVLRQFPGESVEINLAHSLRIIRVWKALVERTNKAVGQVSQQAKWEATETPLPKFFPWEDLQQQGQFQWEYQTLNLHDRSRDRSFLVDLYLPVAQTAVQTPRPVIVISHGLGSDRATLAYLAQHLASYGFAIAIPEHPGSNWQQIQALLTGQANDLAPPREFIDRPLDISYLLDELEHLSQPNQRLQGRLHMQQVGVVGQSFGGYTALALAGAKPRFEQLHSSCSNSYMAFNPSLLLQCQARALPQLATSLGDPRVKAAIAINPIGSRVFGRTSLSQIQVPILMVAGSEDILAPVLLEQIRPFSWLETSHKYLALINGGTHFSSITPVKNPDFLPLWGSNSETVRNYIVTLSTAFFQTHVNHHSHLQPYLSAAYAETMSRDSLSFGLVRSLNQKSLNQRSVSFPSPNLLFAVGAGTPVLSVICWMRIRNRAAH